MKSAVLDPLIQNRIKEELEANAFDVADLSIDVADYAEYVKKVEYRRFPYDRWRWVVVEWTALS